MVHLQKFQQRFADDSLFVFAIAMLDDLETARNMTKERGFTYTIFNGVGSDLGKRYAYG